MNMLSRLAVLALSVAAGASSSHAATFSFLFTPDATLGYEIPASGTITTDDAPGFSMVTSVTGRLGMLTIQGIDPAGFNILSVDTLDAYFGFLASSATVDYTIAIGPGSSAPYSLSVSGSDGNTYDAFGELSISPAFVSAVPLPAAAPLFGAALLALSAVGFGLKRKATAAA